jgi:hypothetical protein
VDFPGAAKNLDSGLKKAKKHDISPLCFLGWSPSPTFWADVFVLVLMN